jgi:hypothetical protein
MADSIVVIFEIMHAPEAGWQLLPSFLLCSVKSREPTGSQCVERPLVEATTAHIRIKLVVSMLKHTKMLIMSVINNEG